MNKWQGCIIFGQINPKNFTPQYKIQIFQSIDNCTYWEMEYLKRDFYELFTVAKMGISSIVLERNYSLSNFAKFFSTLFGLLML